tara:strand:- start:12300 stop:12416 length:117 start_codon:yes stop_codon:yes gene_type:complete
METFLFGVYVVASVFMCWLGFKIDENEYEATKKDEQDS